MLRATEIKIILKQLSGGMKPFMVCTSILAELLIVTGPAGLPPVIHSWP
jgi:hypothetical protein